MRLIESKRADAKLKLDRWDEVDRKNSSRWNQPPAHTVEKT